MPRPGVFQHRRGTIYGLGNATSRARCCPALTLSFRLKQRPRCRVRSIPPVQCGAGAPRVLLAPSSRSTSHESAPRMLNEPAVTLLDELWGSSRTSAKRSTKSLSGACHRPHVERGQCPALHRPPGQTRTNIVVPHHRRGRRSNDWVVRITAPSVKSGHSGLVFPGS